MNDWLDIEPENDDWLDARSRDTPDEGAPAGTTEPELPLSPGSIVAATSAVQARAHFLVAWESLMDQQRVFLNTWRECRFNANRAVRVLKNTSNATSKTTIFNWSANANFEHIRAVLRTASVEEILSRDYLAARQEDIVETLLEPKPILHQGLSTGHFEVEAGAASRANETLLRLGGHLKDKDPVLNVGLVGPSLVIQVVQPNGTVIDATPKHVTIEQLPPPADDGT